MLLTLVAGNLLSRKTRTLLTALAIAISVSLVVAITSGISSFEHAALGFMDRFMGAVDATIRREGDTRSMPESIVADLRADPDVQTVMPRLESDVSLPGQSFNVMANRVTLSGVDRANDPLLGWMRTDEGRWFNPGEQACVIDQGLAARQKLKVGDTFTLKGQHGELSLPIVGIVHKPGLFAGFVLSAYAPLPDVQKFFFGQDNPHRVTQIRVQFKPNTNADAFTARWQDKLKAIDPQIRFKLTRQSRADVDRNFLMLRLLSMLAGAVTLVSAMFIIVSTLAIGVVERQRTLAMLRAIGATKWQVAKLVLTEGTGLGVLGVLIGAPAGFGMSVIIVLILRHWFELTPTLDWLGVLGSSIAALSASALASALPAWQATRVDPLEAMAPLAVPARRGPPWVSGVVGLCLVLFDPCLLYLPAHTHLLQNLRFYSHFIVGLPCLMVGFFLLAPTLVWLIGTVFAPLAARLFRVPFAVVQQHLHGSLWRLAGTCSALMVGLAVLVVMQVQGQSSLQSWKIPDRFPDVFIFTRALSGFSKVQQQEVASAPEFKHQDVMPIGTFAPAVGGGLMGLVGTQLAGNTMFVAVDPDKAFKLMELDFRQGSPEEATRELKLGRHILITDELHRLKNLNMGDTLSLKSATRGNIDFTIAGVVWSPGIDVMVSSFDLSKQFEQQSLACVFGSLADAEKEFGVTNVYLMCANFKQLGENKDAVTEQLRKQLNDDSVNVADVRQLKSTIEKSMGHLLLAASTVAWGALLVASLGVTNTIIAGIRARSWQFGVLRSIGLMRGVLLRAVFIESLLLGVVGATMGLACGLFMTIDGRRLMTLSIGHNPPLVIPWLVVTVGAASVIAVSLLASIWPAIQLSRTSPLALLQAGRSSG